MVVLTDSEQEWLDYLQNLYPSGMRLNAENQNSTIRTYDYVRIFALNMLQLLIHEGNDQLLVDTATDLGLSAWELFLGLPNLTGNPDALRRAIIKARLQKNDSTVKNVRDVIESFLPPLTAYNIRELRQEPGVLDPDDTRTYFVEVAYSVSLVVDMNILRSLLNEVHPAHCLLIFNYITSLLDSIGVEADVTGTFIHSLFTWADEVTGFVSGNAYWGDDADPLSAPIRGS